MFSQFDSEEAEAYFNRLNAQLKKMPIEDRAELHQEVRQHLDALAAAHEELGATPQEAAEATLRQFGDPRKIGRRMRREWQLSRNHGSRFPILETLCASGLLLLLYVGAGNLRVPSSIPDWACLLWVYLCPPLVAGGVFGLLRPGAAVRNAAQASLALAGIGLMLSLGHFSRDLIHIGSQFVYGIQDTGPGIYWKGRWSSDAAIAVHGLAGMLSGLLPSVCAAYLVSALRRGGFYRIQAADFKVRARR